VCGCALNRIDDAGVGDLPQAPLRHDLVRIAALAPDDLEYVLGDLAGEHLTDDSFAA
jgi:hypothetical protein